MAENESKPKGNWKKEGWGKKPDTDTMIVTRIPPQNIDAEKSVRGQADGRGFLPRSECDRISGDPESGAQG